MRKNNSGLAPDHTLILVLAALLVWGFAGLYSASTVEAFKNTGDTAFYLKRQLLQGGLVGLLGCLILARTHYRSLLKFLPFILTLSLSLLVLVKVPDLSGHHGGATRWINLGFFSFQPAEFAKLGLIIYLAAWVEKKKSVLGNFSEGLMPALLMVGLFSALILWQPDMGTALVFISTSLIMLFAAGMRWRHFLSVIFFGLLALGALIKIEPYRFNRIITFFNPSIDPQGISYQVNQAMLAVGAGKLWGYGYGMSRQKHNYLPEAIGDSVFAVTAEEMGFVRVLLLLILFLVFAFLGIRTARQAPDEFGRMLAIGITSWVVLQAFINIAAMLHLVPLTGIPLPFFSYGSSSLIAILWGLGILINISRHGAVKRGAA